MPNNKEKIISKLDMGIMFSITRPSCWILTCLLNGIGNRLMKSYQSKKSKTIKFMHLCFRSQARINPMLQPANFKNISYLMPKMNKLQINYKKLWINWNLLNLTMLMDGKNGKIRQEKFREKYSINNWKLNYDIFIR